jgi:lipoprotein-releasing system permease protein
MQFTFFTYFLKYIFLSKTRQRLIFLAVFGLLISSFSLTIIQGVMGGLQKGLVDRSKTVLGNGFIEVQGLSTSSEKYQKLTKLLIKNKVNFVPELELELLAQNEKYVSPLILHAMDFKAYTPKFLVGRDIEDIILGSDVGRDLRTYFGSKLIITSPSHTDFLIQEIPRQSATFVSDFFTSDIPEVDSVHAWVKLPFLQNLIRKLEINKIRVFETDIEKLIELVKVDFPELNIISWERQNASLVWALNLETRVMLFLFIGMSFLIGICITSGFLLFYNKIKVDLASFWLLGLSRAKLNSLIYLFGQSITVLFSLSGVIFGSLFLYLLDSKKIIIMPDHFIERNIPVDITATQLFISFFVPYLISSVFAHYTFKSFKSDDKSFLALIRRVG